MTVLTSHSSMRPVSLRTNFTDQKALVFSISAADCLFSLSCSAARTKTSDAPEQKMSPLLRQWERPPNGHCGIAKVNRSVKHDCVMTSGREFPKTFQTQNRTAKTRRGWRAH